MCVVQGYAGMMNLVLDHFYFVRNGTYIEDAKKIYTF